MMPPLVEHVLLGLFGLLALYAATGPAKTEGERR